MLLRCMYVYSNALSDQEPHAAGFLSAGRMHDYFWANGPCVGRSPAISVTNDEGDDAMIRGAIHDDHIAL